MSNTHPETPQGTQVDVERFRKVAERFRATNKRSEEHFDCPDACDPSITKEIVAEESAAISAFGEAVTPETILALLGRLSETLAAKEAAEKMASALELQLELFEAQNYPEKLAASEKRSGLLSEALRAMIVVFNRGDKPQKLDEALSWRACDEKALSLAEKALADPQHGGGSGE